MRPRKKTNILTRTIEGMFYIFTANTSLPSLLPTVTFPRDMRKKEKFLKHITGEASLQTSAQSERVTDAFMWLRADVSAGATCECSHRMLCFLPGPLYFSPKCRKHVYRLYHHTRDCTIPACKPASTLAVWSDTASARPPLTHKSLISSFTDFKRCARLLTRLAGSPQCTEG